MTLVWSFEARQMPSQEEAELFDKFKLYDPSKVAKGKKNNDEGTIRRSAKMGWCHCLQAPGRAGHGHGGFSGTTEPRTGGTPSSVWKDTRRTTW